MPEELQKAICNTAQEVVTKTIPKKKKMPRRQRGCLRKLYKQLREKKGKGDKRKVYSTEYRVPENSKER